MSRRTKVMGAMVALLLGAASFGSASAQAGDPAVSAKDQALAAGNSVMVDSVTAAQDGWLVVHESNADGSVKVPDIIGKTQVKAGTTANVMIPLDKQISTPAKLWPMLHIDAGQIGTYEFPGADTPVVVNGEIVMMPVVVTNEMVMAPGMPSTGEGDNIAIVSLIGLVSLTLLGTGWAVRRVTVKR
jgi:hypothetical protein